MTDIIGTTAGTIWEYLDKHGPTTVAKLIRETGVSEKGIQRGIGWLAQEGQVIIELVNRAETIFLQR
jgi:DeoR/GlpR family transcriptional regulator of sugar metabolism